MSAKLPRAELLLCEPKGMLLQGLYAIIDPGACAPTPPQLFAERILQSGCAALQLRVKQKSLDDHAQLALARALRILTKQARVPFIINDRPDIALLAQADGVHLGQDDLPVDTVRELLGEKARIGISTHSVEQFRAALGTSADYLAVGPVFATKSKKNPDPVLGLDGLRSIAACKDRRPIVAIGGITPQNAKSVHAAGADAVAMISALPQLITS